LAAPSRGGCGGLHRRPPLWPAADAGVNGGLGRHRWPPAV